jgi:hypothetical protein
MVLNNVGRKWIWNSAMIVVVACFILPLNKTPGISSSSDGKQDAYLGEMRFENTTNPALSRIGMTGGEPQAIFSMVVQQSTWMIDQQREYFELLKSERRLFWDEAGFTMSFDALIRY